MDSEALLRLGCFFAIFFFVAMWEILWPRRDRILSRTSRWTPNIFITFFNTALLRLILPTTGIGVALWAESKSFGLFNFIQVEQTLSIVLSILMMDLIIYWQHVAMHRIPILWKLHRMHHTDLELDVTSGSRFHPLEIIFSMLVKFSAIALLGVSPVSVLIFEIILNGAAMFNHGNIKIPEKVDRVLRFFIVTPDMHRIHHSVEVDETDSNFGFNIPIWDRVFKTYRENPRAGQLGMTIGLNEFRDVRKLGFFDLLAQPFKKID